MLQSRINTLPKKALAYENLTNSTNIAHPRPATHAQIPPQKMVESQINPRLIED